MAEELAGGFYSLAGPEAADYAVHYVEQETDDGLAVVGAFVDDAGDAGVVLQGRGGEGRGEVFEGFGAPGCAVAGRQRFPVLAGDAVKVAGALAEQDVVALYACQLGYVLGDEPGGDGLELFGCFQPVADLEAFVVELAADDVEVEVDDDLAVVGLLTDDVGKSGRLGLLRLVAIGSSYDSFVLL